VFFLDEGDFFSIFGFKFCFSFLWIVLGFFMLESSSKTERIRVEVFLDRDVFNKALDLAFRVFPDSDDPLSALIEDLLRTFLSRNSLSLSSSSSSSVFSRVLDLIRIDRGFVPDYIYNGKLKIYVMRARNIKDPNAVAQWIFKFYADGYISPVNCRVYDWRDCKRNHIKWRILVK